MKKIHFYILILFAVSCQENDPVVPVAPEETPWEPFFAGKISGDSIEYFSFNPAIEFPGSLDTADTFTLTDTLHLDLDSNGFSDFILIYREEYWNGSTKPTYQRYDIISPNDVQLPRNEISWEDLIHRCDSSEVINNELTWIWEPNSLLCYRQLNSFVGKPNDYFYVIFNKPWSREYGWIRMKLEMDDYYFESLIIEDYAVKEY